MALLTWMTCWVLSRSMMLWAPTVILIELHREQKGRGCHRRNGPGARRKEHSLGQGKTWDRAGEGCGKILGSGLWG